MKNCVVLVFTPSTIPKHKLNYPVFPYHRLVQRDLPQPPGIFILCKTVYSPMREPSGKANCSCRSGIINNGT